MVRRRGEGSGGDLIRYPELIMSTVENGPKAFRCYTVI